MVELKFWLMEALCVECVNVFAKFMGNIIDRFIIPAQVVDFVNISDQELVNEPWSTFSMEFHAIKISGVQVGVRIFT